MPTHRPLSSTYTKAFQLILICAVPLLANVNTALLRSTFEQQKQHNRVVYRWNGPAAAVLLDLAGRIHFTPRQAATSESWTLRFPGANPNSMPEGEASGRAVARYYNETAPAGVEIPQFQRIRYRDLYPGIDLLFHIENGTLEYDFEIGAHANPAAISIEYASAAVRLEANGDIAVGQGLFQIRQKPPEVRQAVNGLTVRIPCHYKLAAGGTVGLELGAYNPAVSLTIDPVVNFTTTLSGPGTDTAYAIAVDSAGAVYIAGDTDSQAFTSTAARRPSRDVFVAKLNAAGTAVVYVTYLGGSSFDTARGLAVDSSGNAYITGWTTSTDFPATTGVVGVRNGGMDDALVVKLSSYGSVVYSTMVGSIGSDQAYALAIDASGNAYIAGKTSGSFPVTSGALQTSFHGGNADCFVAKLNASATVLVYSTFLGGTADDICRGIAVDSSGYAYVTGVTYSSNFPVSGAPQSALKGVADAFVTKINTTGTAVVYSTYLGGDYFDEANAIAVDSSGSAYVAGDTTSLDFPVTSSAYQTSAKGSYDAFVVKLSAAGDTFSYATLLGGIGTDTATAIALDSSGRAIVSGFTSSLDLPMVQAAQTALSGNVDIFAAVFDASGSSLILCTYLGGSGDDRAYAAAVTSGNHLYLTGYTQSTDFPGIASGTVTPGNTDIVVAEVTFTLPATSGLVFVPVTACRVVDTRSTSGLGTTFGPPYIPKAGTRSFPLPQSGCGIPLTAQAYSVNLTAIPRTSTLGWITIWPTGQTTPTASTLNAYDGRTVQNEAIVPAGTNGAISVYASDDADILLDVNGYFVSPSLSGFMFYPLSPCRIADTRGYDGVLAPFSTPYMSAGSTRAFPILQSPKCTIPSSAQVYSLNFTVVPRASTLQGLTAWPVGQAQPAVSTLSSMNGQVVANAAIVAAGTSGSIDLYVVNDTDVLFDINGYFGAAGGTGALSFTPVTPCRVIDTRCAYGNCTTIAAGTSHSIDVLGASSCHIPSTAIAYSFNVTAVPPGALGWVTVWPTGQTMPVVSTLNSPKGAILANAAIVPAGTGGKVDVYASDKTDIIIDINGYFAP